MKKFTWIKKYFENNENNDYEYLRNCKNLVISFKKVMKVMIIDVWEIAKNLIIEIYLSNNQEYYKFVNEMISWKMKILKYYFDLSQWEFKNNKIIGKSLYYSEMIKDAI